MPTPTNQVLYDKVKEDVMNRYKKPSAYASGAIVKEYKKRGGKYKEDGEERDLERWFLEEWKNVAKPNQYPVLRPTKKISKETPLTLDEIPKSVLNKQVKLKQKIKGDKNLPEFKGGSLKTIELKDFLEASYLEPAPNKINDYTLDTKLSNLYGKVYTNSKMKKVIVSFRGTKEASDWTNNAVFALDSNAYKLTNRYKTAKKMVESARKKYKGWQFEIIGHSQGGLLVNTLCSKKDKDCISLNPAYKNASLKDNEYIIRSSGDVVSTLSAPKKFLNSILYPNWTKNHLITIPAKTNNPLTEHKIDILDRLDPNKKIGRGGSKATETCSCEKKRELKKYRLNVCLSTI